MEQATIARRVEIAGVGLHSGARVRLTFSPAEPDRGIVFVRTAEGAREGRESERVDSAAGLRRTVEIPARVASLQSHARATTLVAPTSDASNVSGLATGVSTVEHLLATLYALAIDNLRIELDGPEVPIFDGSAEPLLEVLYRAGRVAQVLPRRTLHLRETIEIRDGERWIRAEPCDRLRIGYAIDFDHPEIGRQTLEIPELDASVFERALSRARTFGFMSEVEALHAEGLARGGGLANTIVLGERRVMNPDGLRFPDEFVRHKVVDLIGDLALLGAPLAAHVRVERGGHMLHHQLVRTLASRVETIPAARSLPHEATRRRAGAQPS